MSPAYETIFEESCDYYAHDVYQFNNFFKNEEQKEGILKDYEFDKMNEGRAKAKLKNGKEKCNTEEQVSSIKLIISEFIG